jgi:hypothetical protein
VTVAAVILAASAESALADAEGVASVRRIADTAWAGGATPIVVVAADTAGAVAQALSGAAVTLAEPAPVAGGPAAQITRGMDVAVTIVDETTASLVWPARLAWVGAETVTSLIETHGVDASAVLRPEFGGELGWPALVPTVQSQALGRAAPDRSPDELLEDLVAAGAPLRRLELGDPGTTIDRTTPRSELPPYEGPPQPAAAHVHEWGAALADESEEAPLEGPALAPYGQAIASDPDQPG